MIDGVGPDAPIVSDSKGYKTSETPYRMDLMPGAALLHLGNIMRYGAENHGEDNWRCGDVKDHINKALIHICALLDGDTQDDHLGHAAWRLLAALEVDIQSRREPNPTSPDAGSSVASIECLRWTVAATRDTETPGYVTRCCIGDGCETRTVFPQGEAPTAWLCRECAMKPINGGRVTRCVA